MISWFSETFITVKPRFWNTFALKILLKKRFFAADQNFKLLHRSPRFWNKPRFWNTFSGIPKSRFYFYCTAFGLILKYIHTVKELHFRSMGTALPRSLIVVYFVPNHFILICNIFSQILNYLNFLKIYLVKLQYWNNM